MGVRVRLPTHELGGVEGGGLEMGAILSSSSNGLVEDRSNAWAYRPYALSLPRHNISYRYKVRPESP
jgi:hypothetical protein